MARWRGPCSESNVKLIVLCTADHEFGIVYIRSLGRPEDGFLGRGRQASDVRMCGSTHYAVRGGTSGAESLEPDERMEAMAMEQSGGYFEGADAAAFCYSPTAPLLALMHVLKIQNGFL